MADTGKKSFDISEREIRQRISLLELKLHEANVSLNGFRPAAHNYTEEECAKVVKAKKIYINTLTQELVQNNSMLNQGPCKKGADYVVVAGKEGQGLIGYKK